jgi:hypothetical protein
LRCGSPSPKWLSSKPLKNTGLARPAVKLRHPCGCPRRRRKSLWRIAARRSEKLKKKSRLGQRTHHTQTRVQRCSRPLRTARVGPYCGRSTKASVKRADVPCARIWNISISDAFRRLHWKPEGDEKSFGVSAACQGMSWLGEAIEISRAPADASEHGRHMGIARQRSYQDRRRPGANCQVGKSRREEP